MRGLVLRAHSEDAASFEFWAYCLYDQDDGTLFMNLTEWEPSTRPESERLVRSVYMCIRISRINGPTHDNVLA